MAILYSIQNVERGSRLSTLRLVFSIVLFYFVIGHSLAEDLEENEYFEYLATNNEFRPYSALEIDNKILLFGGDFYQAFDLDTKQFGPAKRHHIDGHISQLEQLPNGDLVAAGFNRHRIISFKDSRQNMAMLLKLRPDLLDHTYRNALSIAWTKEFWNRLSSGIEIDALGQPVLLSEGDRRNRLSVFNHSLRRRLHFLSFGSGSIASFTMTKNGNFVVVGYEGTESASDVFPKYWVINSELEIERISVLGSESHRRSGGYKVAQAKTDGESVYLLYGWKKEGDGSGSDVDLSLIKLDANLETVEWKVRLPYSRHIEMFIARNGVPYVIYPWVRELEFKFINPDNGSLLRTAFHKRPLDLTPCFDARQWYDVVDVVHAKNGNDYVVLSHRTDRNGTVLGCVAVAEFRLH